MDEKTLTKLNTTADKIILNEAAYPLDTEFLLKMLKKMISAHLIKKPNKGVEVLLTKEEILKSVLDFYKSIDTEYYNEALDYLLQLKRNKSLEIFFSNTHRLSRIKQIAKEQRGYFSHDYISGKSNIFIPTKLTTAKEEIEIFNKNEYVIQDSVTTVHEIAHSLDVKKIEGIIPKLITINTQPHKVYKTKEFQNIAKKIEKNISVRNVFSETTAITFEKLYTQYLMKIKDYPKSNISSIAIERFNDSLHLADECYDNLRIAKIKKDNGKICNDDISLLMAEYNESYEIIEKRIKRIIRRNEKLNGKINGMKKYAIAGLFSPTLANQYQTNGVNVLKQYIEAVKNNSIDQIFDILQIQKNEDGINTLFLNMEKQIEPYRFFPDKENTILEK